MISTVIKFGAIAALAGLLAGCNTKSSTAGTLTLGLTDAPVDNVAHVWVQFTGITVKPQGGSPVDFPFSTPKNIDLTTLTGGNSTDLLNGQKLAAGPYEWIRLNVNATIDGNFDSYVVTTTGQEVELDVPSQQGLQLSSGFTITQSQDTSFVIDWNLREGLSAPTGTGGWILRPSLRITDMTQYGSISGMVTSSLISGPGSGAGACDTGSTADAVYVYSGANVVPKDIEQASTDPLTTAPVAQDSSGNYTYKVSYLSPGDYTLTFTCQASSDDPTTADTITFVDTQNATVTNGTDTTVDFK